MGNDKENGGDLGNDLLWGAPAIAAFLSITPRRVYDWHEGKKAPIGKLGKLLFARKSTLREHFESLERN
jgi:hypothetical protein